MSTRERAYKYVNGYSSHKGQSLKEWLEDLEKNRQAYKRENYREGDKIEQRTNIHSS